ncbi:efflux RND transporter permease subunit [Puniceicoccaceae bacterium K14]|nr:efflux RND transporter permease subunit [Puniceicoccaceae bacterium K14]
MHKKSLTSSSSRGLGLMAVMVNRPVAANLCMLLLLLLGGIFLLKTKREVFPAFALDRISIQVSVPGSSAEEIETGVLLSLEQRLQSVRGVKRISSEARRSVGIVYVDISRGADANAVMQDVKNAVDQISTFPAEADRPIVRLMREDDLVLSILLYGKREGIGLYKIAERIRVGLLQNSEINRVEHGMERQREITVEISPLVLERLGLTHGEVAKVIRQSSLDQLGGYLRSDLQESVVRLNNRMYTVGEYENLAVLVGAEGQAVPLSEVANVSETLGESRSGSHFDGVPAVRLDLFREGDARPGDVVEGLKEYLQENPLPEDMAYQLVDDATTDFQGRIKLMIDNAWMGLILVWISLSLFLNRRVAFWVMLGIPICFIGAFIPIYFFGGTINMFSLTAFIISLGIVVDDAIIVGEGVYEYQQTGLKGRRAAYAALRKLGGPVIFAVLTNIVAFMPMFFLPGFLGKILFHIPVVVVSVLLISLAESLLILPAHLVSSESKDSRSWIGIRKTFDDGLRRFREGVFERILRVVLQCRYLSLAGLMGGLILCFGLLSGGVVKTALTPKLESNTVMAVARLPAGSTVEFAQQVESQLTTSLNEVVENLELREDEIIGTWSSLADKTFDNDVNSGGRLNVRVKLLLDPEVKRSLGAEEIAGVWKETIGDLAGVEFFGVSGSEDVGSEPILLELRHPNMDLARDAALELERAIQSYGVASSIAAGTELRMLSYELELNANGRSLGVNESDLSNTVRGMFFGIEAVRFQDESEEVKVMVRGPLDVVRTQSELERLPIRLEGVGTVYLGEVANIRTAEALEQIVRSNGGRVVPVSIELRAEADEDGFAELLEGEILPELQSKYPKLDYEFTGEQKEDQETFAALGLSLGLACLGIYTLLAFSFDSYTKPLVVALVVPFGIGGAILGHLVMGMAFSLVSFVGVLALSGIVVNDALVLVHAHRDYEREGLNGFQAALNASQRRLRPIFITSITTFVGLMPLLLETSMQARFIVPLAVSIGFGVLFSTVTTLLLVPCLLLALADVAAFLEGMLIKIQKKN